MKQKHIGYLIGSISIGINAILFGIKFWVGIKYDSVALIADAWHTLSDSLTSLVVIIGLFISLKPADENHPFGHGRSESIATIIIGILLFLVGVNFLKESIVRIVSGEEVSYGILAIIVHGITLIAKELLAQVSIRIGKNNNIQSLVADGWHHRSDAITSIIIIIGVFLTKYIPFIDSILGIVVSLMIMWTAFDILRKSSHSLLGVAPKREQKESINAVILEAAPEADDIHHIHIHDYGLHTEATIHIRLLPQMTVQNAHQIASKIENALRSKLNIEATIHIEPLIKKKSIE